ncbi:EAL domain-containing protein [Jannaschia sp. LMIT008]|uniref:sensor domain-containing phosphodiesterase n=1 Tax=Jannaschia maritima TaxID=3032585 RepID=UPI002811AA05|nr:EAL domain-containing protein [Jannaschia sp. LMIT008]
MRIEDLAKRAAAEGDADGEAIINRALDSVREHLGMPIAYLSEFVGDQTVFRNVSAPGLTHLIKPGDSKDLNSVYCKHILSGDLPQLIPDTGAIPLARSLPITKDAPIGSHVSLPIQKPDGTTYGMFCCLSPTPNPSLNERDLKVMRMFAGLAAEQVRHRLSAGADKREARDRTRVILDGSGFETVFQPIYRMNDGALAGFEALSRFRSPLHRGPRGVFDDARRAGMVAELELAVLDRALDAVPDLDAGQRLSVNASPSTIGSGRLRQAFGRCGPSRVTLEITEAEVDMDAPKVVGAVTGLRSMGVQIAVDDVGAGYAGLQQLLQLRPDILKLDISLVRHIDTDAARRSMAAALVHFAGETRATVTAEGVETRGEWSVLKAMGVECAQGWLTGRPGPMADAPTHVRV